MLCGYGGTFADGTSYGEIAFADKLTVGGYFQASEFRARGYGFAKVGAGFFGCEDHLPWEMPLIGSIAFGGGFEFQYAPSSSFVVEYGGTWERAFGGGEMSGYQNSSPLLIIGCRTYFGK